MRIPSPLRYSVFGVRYWIFLLVLPLSAQQVDWFTDLAGENLGHTTCGFLTLPVSAGAMALNDVATPSVGDATDLPVVPSASAFFTRYSVAFTHLEWLLGLRKEYLAAAFPILEVGTAGVFSQVFTAGDFGPARDIDEYATDPDYVEYSLGASFARPIIYNWLSGGIAASYVESRLDQIVGRTASFSGGLSLRVPWIDAHVYAANLGPSITYVSTPEPLPTLAGCAIRFAPLDEHPRLKKTFTFAISAGAQKTADEPLLAGAGAEIRLVNIIAARAGYEYRYQAEPGVEGLSLGAGVRIREYAADFGWKYQSEDLGAVWSLSASAEFREVKPRTALEYYEVAEKHYRRGHRNAALMFARRSVSMDPNLWRAHALVARILAERRREQRLEMVLIYTGGCKGNFIPMVRGEGTIGGLARQAWVIAELRRQYPVSLVLNTGNNLTGTTDPRKKALIDTYLLRVQNGATAYGPGEIDFDAGKGSPVGVTPDARAVCTNHPAAPMAGLLQSRLATAGAYRFYVAATVDSSDITTREARAQVTSPAGALRRAMEDPDAASCNLRIAIVNDSWTAVRDLAAQTPGLDLIICSGLSQRFESPMRIGSCLALSAGDSGACVGALTLRFDRAGKLLSCDNRLIPLTEGVGSDQELERLSNEVAMELELQEKGIAPDSLAHGGIEGTFPFVSDRAGVPQILLKVIRASAEFPLTVASTPCLSPAISFACGKIAFIGVDSSDQKVLRVMNVNGTGARVLAPNLRPGPPVFSPDGQWIYFGAAEARGNKAGIYRIKSDGLTPIKVLGFGTSVPANIAFSPDGLEMAFASNRDGFWRIYTASAEGEGPICISEGRYTHVKPSFSSDSRQIAYLSDRGSVMNRLDLWVYDRHSGKVFQETHGASIGDYTWLGDGRSIVYTGGRERKELHRIDVFTADTATLISTEKPKTYDELAPRPIWYLGDEKILYTRAHADGSRHIYWVDPEGTNDGPVVRSRGSDWIE